MSLLGYALSCNVANVLDQVEITWGSGFYVEMPTPQNCTVTAYDWSATYSPVDAIGEPLTVTWAYAGQYLFNGVIRGIEVESVGNGNYLYTITASAPWENIGLKSIGGSGYVAETDSARIDELLNEAGAVSWADFDSVSTWSTMQPNYADQTWSTWATYVDQIIGFSTASAATYDFQAYTAGAVSAINLLDSTSADCRGRFYSPLSSSLLYWKSYGDVATALTSPSVVVYASQILEDSMGMVGDVGSIYSQVTLTDGINDPVSVVDSDAVVTYGVRDLEIQTDLDVLDQLPVATAILATAAQLRSQVRSFTIPVVDGVWTAAAFDAFRLQVLQGIGAVTLSGIPAIFGGTQNGLILGGTMRYANGELLIACNFQNVYEIAPVQMWSQVDVSYTWATYLPNTIWSDAA